MRFPRVAILLTFVLAWMPPARAQLLPQLPQLPLPQPGSVLGAAAGTLESATRTTARELRDLRVRDVLRRYPREVERDPRGAPIMRSVILALSPSPAALQAAQSAGFTVQGDEALPGIGERIVTLVAPPGFSTRRALNQLRRRDPGGRYDFSHLYFESAERRDAASDSPVAVVDVAVPVNPRIGLVDSGVEREHPALAAVPIERFGCSGRAVPAAHGTAVASLLVGFAPDFHGAAPGARLFAADAWCGDAGPGGRVEDVVRSLGWLVGERVGVINLSLVGPPNVVLEAVIRRVRVEGILVVAAAGNDGPNAPPLYPAAYDGVIAVTGVDSQRRALLEAARGKHVRFAAPGADVLAASPGAKYAPVRGTSFAAPLVAGMLATHLAAGETSAESLASLAREALDLGRKGRDDVYGEGLVAERWLPAVPARAAANK
jgi:hypothetical protein